MRPNNPAKILTNITRKSLMTPRSLQDTLLSFTQRRSAKIAGRLLHMGVVAAVLYILIEKLSNIGWQAVWAAMPETPFFYIFFLLMYFTHPIGEWLVYRKLWGNSIKPHFTVFLKMRVYNLALVSYMGEAFLALWAKRNLGLSGRNAASAVKDSNILSALVSNSITLLLLAVFFLGGSIEKVTAVHPDYGFYMSLAFGLGILLVPLVLYFQKKILAAPKETIRHILQIHALRLIAVLVLQLGFWSSAIPEAPMEAWLLLLTAQMVLTRIPFIPNTDLMFMGLGISLMGFIEAPETALAGMFLASGAMAQVLNLICFSVGYIPAPKSMSGADRKPVTEVN